MFIGGPSLVVRETREAVVVEGLLKVVVEVVAEVRFFQIPFVIFHIGLTLL